MVTLPHCFSTYTDQKFMHFLPALVSFLLLWLSTLTNSNLKEKGLVWFTVLGYSHLLREAKAKGQAGSHTISAVGSREKWMALCLIADYLSWLSILLHRSSPDPGNNVSHIQSGYFLLKQDNLTGQTNLNNSNRLPSQKTLDFVKCIVKINSITP